MKSLCSENFLARTFLSPCLPCISTPECSTKHQHPLPSGMSGEYQNTRKQSPSQLGLTLRTDSTAEIIVADRRQKVLALQWTEPTEAHKVGGVTVGGKGMQLGWNARIVDSSGEWAKNCNKGRRDVDLRGLVTGPRDYAPGQVLWRGELIEIPEKTLRARETEIPGGNVGR